MALDMDNAKRLRRVILTAEQGRTEAATKVAGVHVVRLGMGSHPVENVTAE